MAMKTKEDVQAHARKVARYEILVTDHPYMRSSNSWQAKAYYEAFDEERARLDASSRAFFQQPGLDTAVAGAAQLPMKMLQGIHASESSRIIGTGLARSIPPKGSGNMLKPIPPEAMPQTGMVGWPQGAIEHARKLKHALSKELEARRAARLLASLNRLYARHDRHA